MNTMMVIESELQLMNAAYELETQRDINTNLITVIIEAGETDDQEVSRFKKWWVKICKFFKMIASKLKEWWNKAISFIKSKLAKKPKSVKREEMKDDDIPQCSDAELKVIRDFLTQRIDGMRLMLKSVKEINGVVNKVSIASIKKGESVKSYDGEGFTAGKENFEEVKRIYTEFKKSIYKYKVETDGFSDIIDISDEVEGAFEKLMKAFKDMESRIEGELKQYNVKSKHSLNDITEYVNTLRETINNVSKFGAENFNMSRALIQILY